MPSLPKSILFAQTEKALFAAIDETLAQPANSLDWNALFSHVQDYHPAATLSFASKYRHALSPDAVMQDHIERAGNLGDLARGLSLALNDGAVVDPDGSIAQKILNDFTKETKTGKDFADYYMRRRYVRFFGYLAEIYTKFKTPDANKWFKTLSSFVSRHAIKRNAHIDLGGNLQRWKHLPGMEKYSKKIDDLIHGAHSGSDQFIRFYEENGANGLADEWMRLFSESFTSTKSSYDAPDLRTFLRSTSRWMVEFSFDEKLVVTQRMTDAMQNKNAKNEHLINSFGQSEMDFLWHTVLLPVFNNDPDLENKWMISIAPVEASAWLKAHPDRMTPFMWHYFIENSTVERALEFIGMAMNGRFKKIISLPITRQADESIAKFMKVRLSRTKLTEYTQQTLQKFFQEDLSSGNLMSVLESMPRLKSLVAALCFECSEPSVITDLLQPKASRTKHKTGSNQYDKYTSIHAFYGQVTADYVLMSEATGVIDSQSKTERVLQVWACIDKGFAVEQSFLQSASATDSDPVAKTSGEPSR